MICAAKEIHSVLVEGVGQGEMQQTVRSFLEECRRCSKLRHPNVIQFLGIYYPFAGKMQLPVMVMEMMANSLTELVKKHNNIPIHIKYAIVHDVSLGLRYLHNHDIVHRDISPNNILLTKYYVAKISDLGVAKVLNGSRNMTRAPGTTDFMPPESLESNPKYGPSMDVFSFAGIVLHTFNQEWPSPCEARKFDSDAGKPVALNEVERRKECIDKMTGEAEALKPLVLECLEYDPDKRPNIGTICERIRAKKDDCIKKCSQDVITLHQQVQHLHQKVEQKDKEITKAKKENEELKQNPVRVVTNCYSSGNHFVAAFIHTLRTHTPTSETEG